MAHLVWGGGGERALSGRQREAEGRAQALLAFDAHGGVVGLDEGLDDGEAQAPAALLLRVGLGLVEHFFQALRRNARAVVAHPALEGELQAVLPLTKLSMS